MGAYVIRRLLQGVPILIGVTLITFTLLNVFGGDPVVARLGKSSTLEDQAALRAEYGLDKPLWQQYFRYLQEISTFDFGRSFVTRESVRDILASGAGPSLSITMPALLLTTLISITLGMISAFNRGKAIDRAIVVLAVMGMSVSFLVYIVAGQYFVAFKTGWFQIYGYESGLVERWQYLYLPILIQVIVGVGYDVRFYRAVMVDESTKLYIVTAYAKGLPRWKVMFKHMLKNALIPIITRVMIAVPFLVTGSLLIESFFGIPGLGHRMLAAIDEQDYPVIKAFTFVISSLFIAGNIVTDLLYAAADPRVRLR
ncbi:MAG: ABC transporter permease [Candidatus Schekmanbacteria bacterium]|nr:ABC transporter permease [Candidatus Schekmanbacteria bacterium]